MRPTDRLFEIIQLFRHGRLLKGQDIAAATGVSVRTVYRDIENLIASGIPIEGERGVGYILREPIFLPPLALKPTELEALHLGMAMVQQSADKELGEAARDLMLKIDAVLPSSSPRSSFNWGYAVHLPERFEREQGILATVRLALRKRNCLQIRYRSLDGTLSGRIIRPLQIEFWGKVWTLTAWCESRQDFRVFRVDRIEQASATGVHFTNEAGKGILDYLKTLAEDGH